MDRQAIAVELLNYLNNNDIVLSYWSPSRNELMPITYTTESLALNFRQNKPAVSGKVRKVK